MTDAARNIQARTGTNYGQPAAAKGKLRLMTKQTKAQEAKVEPYMAKMPDGSLHDVHHESGGLFRVNEKLIFLGDCTETKRGQGTITTYDFTPDSSAYVTWVQKGVVHEPKMRFKRDSKTKRPVPLAQEDWEPLYQHMLAVNEKANRIAAELGDKSKGSERYILPEPEAPEERPKPLKPSKNDKRPQLQ
ncbi:MAG: hypothetical protein EOM37_06620 [Proteobacteria bacterium]|jgi:hypothetical protein|nr:hypothetical protein [Alphaproteobacteria bacterium]NCC03701.1 hypothetical protein [Pseudomonadota bacterium]